VRPNKAYGRLQGSIPIGRSAWGMAASAGGDFLYIANTGDNTVSVFDLRLMRIGFTVPTGKAPLGLAVH
jgi:YVTN family beta-propeller protein